MVGNIICINSDMVYYIRMDMVAVAFMVLFVVIMFGKRRNDPFD